MYFTIVCDPIQAGALAPCTKFRLLQLGVYFEVNHLRFQIVLFSTLEVESRATCRRLGFSKRITRIDAILRRTSLGFLFTNCFKFVLVGFFFPLGVIALWLLLLTGQHPKGGWRCYCRRLAGWNPTSKSPDYLIYISFIDKEEVLSKLCRLGWDAAHFFLADYGWITKWSSPQVPLSQLYQVITIELQSFFPPWLLWKSDCFLFR